MFKQDNISKPSSSFSTEEISGISLMSDNGDIPKWLRGTLVRAGLFPVQINNKKLHWFDEPSMLHSFSFEENKVYYTNRFLRTDAYKKVFSEGNFNYIGFATERDSLLWSSIKSFFSADKTPVIQNANVNIAKVASEYIALTETPLPVRFDIKTLYTLGALEFQDDLPSQNIFESAHIQANKKTQEKINYLTKYGKESFYTIYRLNNESARREIIGEIEVKNPSYMHSFALTKNYIILVEFPLVINPLQMIISGKPFIKNFTWEPKHGTNFLIISKNTGKLVQSIRYHNPFFAFHHVNAYEEGSEIILDIITYQDSSIISALSEHGDLQLYNDCKEEYDQKLMRYTISLSNKSIEEKVLAHIPIEFPRINDNFNTEKYSYLYGADPRLLSKNDDLRPIYKVNVRNGDRITWQEPGLLPGEPIFVANPKAKDEDDGVIMSIVLDVNNKKSFLLILDSKSFKEISRIYTPHCIPLGLHGQFFGN